MSGDRKIAKWMEAKCEYTALDIQRRRLDGEELTQWDARWGGDRARALVALKLAAGALTGGEQARALREYERRLIEEATA